MIESATDYPSPQNHMISDQNDNTMVNLAESYVHGILILNLEAHIIVSYTSLIHYDKCG